jgi:hypothetical protein
LQAVTESKNVFDVVSGLACISRFDKEIGLVHQEAREYLNRFSLKQNPCWNAALDMINKNG